MPTITLSEAIDALKAAKKDPATVDREIAILEGECKQLQGRIKGKRDLIKTLRKLCGGKAAIERTRTARAGADDEPKGPSETQVKLIGYLKKSGPQLASEIAKDLGLSIGPTAAILTRAYHLFTKRADGRWVLTPAALT